jgi:hypothetical protein
MRPGGAPRKLRCAGQRRRDGVWQRMRRVQMTNAGRPFQIRQNRITELRNCAQPVAATDVGNHSRIGLALLNK